MKTLNLLFISNSHTYYNDMPLMVQRRAGEAGSDFAAKAIWEEIQNDLRRASHGV